MEKGIMIKDFNISEKGHGSYWPLGILRWVMILIFISFGIQKFTPQSADGIWHGDQARKGRPQTTPDWMSSLFATARSLRFMSFLIPNLHSGHGTLAGLAQMGLFARGITQVGSCSELAADNRLVGSSGHVSCILYK